MTDVQSGAIDEEVEGGKEQRKFALLKWMGRHIVDPHSYPIAACRMGLNEKRTRIGDETGVGDAIDAILPWNANRADVVLGMWAGIYAYPASVPESVKKSNFLRRKATMYALGRFKGARDVNEKDGVESARTPEGAER